MSARKARQQAGLARTSAACDSVVEAKEPLRAAPRTQVPLVEMGQTRGKRAREAPWGGGGGTHRAPRLAAAAAVAVRKSSPTALAAAPARYYRGAEGAAGSSAETCSKSA